MKPVVASLLRTERPLMTVARVSALHVSHSRLLPLSCMPVLENLPSCLSKTSHSCPSKLVP